MTETELKRLQRAGLRSARRALRAMDSQLEKLERWYNRMLKRKTRVRPDQLEPGYRLVDELKAKSDAALFASTDFFGAVNI